MNSIIKILVLFLVSNFIFMNSPLAVITQKKGEVLYKKYNLEKIDKNINMGMSIFNNDFFQTGDDGSFTFLYLDDGTMLKVYKNSELYIRGKVDNNAIKKRLNVGNGSIRFDVKKQKDEEFTVVTPSSVASVKGTDFFLNSDGIKDQFFGFEGTVEIINKESNSMIRLTKNTKITSLSDGSIEIVAMTQDDLNLIQEIQSSMIFDENSPNQESIIPNESNDLNQEIKEIRIKVINDVGEEKEIIIRYTE